jgi:hypothetical protein
MRNGLAQSWPGRIGASLTAVGLAAACLAAGGTLPASAATTTHWRVSYRLANRDSEIWGIAAPGARSAWAAGARFSGDDFRSSFYLHWTGHGWHQVSVPHPATFAALRIAASAPDNVWILGAANGGDYSALVYNGARWITLAAPADGPTVVLSKNDVWVESGVGCARASGAWHCTTTLYHWNGAVWKSSSLPVYGLDLVGAGRHVWLTAAASLRSAGPPRETGREAVYRWSGSRWTRVAAPDGEITGYVSAAAAPDGRLWLLAKDTRAAALHLDYWNGRRWTREKRSAFGSAPNQVAMAFSARAGLWADAKHWTGSRWADTLPAASFEKVFGVGGTVPVPGTSALFGIAQARPGGHFVIAAYGKTG